jgi:ATP-binding cassette subfamily B protein
MDRSGAWQTALIPGGWMLIGLLALVPSYVSGQATPAMLAVGLGGVLLAQRGLGGLSGALAALGGAAIAWREAALLFATPSASQGDQQVSALSPQAGQAAQSEGRRDPPPVIEASGLVYRHSPQAEPVLRGVDLTLRHGDRVLLEGASGAGKSTLAGLLSGLARPDAGLLLLRGLDRTTWGDRWQRWATEAPQFHENHIFGGSLAFNLLMGRDWPPSAADLQQAGEVCEELGLGELLQRMPAGLQQQVGETGWQLSHGERSRVFLARALLQQADLTILDESFAALDPQTLERCLKSAFGRANTLMVIAHP